MLNKPLSAAAGLLLSALATNAAHAAVFDFEYNDTISNSTVPGISLGDTIKITLALDNGGNALNSQTWAAADLQSVTISTNNGATVTTFSAPFGGSLNFTAGSFVTDGGGALISVLSDWEDLVAGIDTTTTLAGLTATGWGFNGFNDILFFTDGINFDTVGISHVNTITNAAAWSFAPPSSPVPLPATLWLMLPGLALLGRSSARAAG